ncbi:sulfurtransferase TusA family protein [Marinivivus vitaminiproducens]|uniref:sulfurtransferase TusA family protein n=1 Tax=Marinivivus vitaminiproducens TaxID=3035935 RepID=UPI0027A7C438|nr:sulfurtransferase TusA family protein [Geminicoccaceae bacterium SCSIO 64248]
MTAHTLDARGLSCPLPVLRAQRALRALPAGATLTVLATDPASARDMPAYCEAAGHALLASEEEGGDFRFVIRCGG